MAECSSILKEDCFDMLASFEILVDRIYDRDHLITTWNPKAHDFADGCRDATARNLAGDGAIGGGNAVHRERECRLLEWKPRGDTLYLMFGPAAALRQHSPSQGSTVLLTDAAGVSSVVRSSDGLLLIQKRSDQHVRYPGWFHVCGGMLETQQVAKRMTVDPFAWMQVELEEELFIKRDYLTRMLCLGLVRDLHVLRPELVFETVLCVPADRFAQRSGPEHSDLLFILDTADDLLRFVADRGPLTVPSGLACLLLYGKQRFGYSWYRHALEIVSQ